MLDLLQRGAAQKAVVVGILNVTPDSFSDGGRFTTPERAAERAFELKRQGAEIIDLGGESTRPGAIDVSEADEVERVLPVVEAIRKCSDLLLSIDTRKAGVAREALKRGANMINDISAGRADPHMFQVVAEAGVPIVLMHMRGDPQTMQRFIQYDDVVKEVIVSLRTDMERAMREGVKRENILVDPGIGFAKSAEGNLELLRRLEELKALEAPILIGTSRKSFMGHIVGHALEDRLEGTLATLSFSWRKGVRLFRVHDVASARRYLDMVETLEASPTQGREK